MLISRKSEMARSVQVQVKMLCTWQLLWLAAKKPWFTQDKPFVSIFAQASMENVYLIL